MSLTVRLTDRGRRFAENPPQALLDEISLSGRDIDDLILDELRKSDTTSMTRLEAAVLTTILEELPEEIRATANREALIKDFNREIGSLSSAGVIRVQST